jgi:lysozyme
MRRRILLAVSLAAIVGSSAGVFVVGYCRAGWLLIRPDPERFPVWGVDVSHHQGTIDWSAVAGDGRVRFAYVKATEGLTFVDPSFARNFAGARARGLRVGAYHYFSFCTPGVAQAEHFLSVVPADARDLPAALDVEWGGQCSVPPARDALLREIAAWSDVVERRLGKRPIVYVTGDGYRALLRGSGLPNILWIRDLTREPAPEAGEAWALWQFHARGRVEGVSGPVDLDAYRADAAFEQP